MFKYTAELIYHTVTFHNIVMESLLWPRGGVLGLRVRIPEGYVSPTSLYDRKIVYTQLISVYDTVGEHLDEGKQTDMIFLDFSKVFDSVNHDMLIHKLRKLGFSGKLLLWIIPCLDRPVSKRGTWHLSVPPQPILMEESFSLCSLRMVEIFSFVDAILMCWQSRSHLSV